jgi:hypothetical protein
MALIGFHAAFSPTASTADRLEREHADFRRGINNVRLPPFLAPQADRSYDHMPRWVEALRLI